jgi:hypothetical protein
MQRLHFLQRVEQAFRFGAAVQSSLGPSGYGSNSPTVQPRREVQLSLCQHCYGGSAELN